MLTKFLEIYLGEWKAELTLMETDELVKLIKMEKKKLIKPEKKKLKKRNIITLNPSQAGGELQLVSKKFDELSKHQTNVRTMLLCTNATPIRKYGGVGYMCCFCDREFPEPGLLKSHARRTHDKSTLSTFKGAPSMANFVVKLDITDLHCTLCNTPFETVDDAAGHLMAAHSQPYYPGLKSHILPFRFTDQMFRCVECGVEFSNFKVLLEHMNAHYRNHVCETCGKGYVNRVQLQTHAYRHRTGRFDCARCGKVFDTRVKCREHARATHVLNNTRSKCGYCGERFKDYTKKREHEVAAHGAAGVSLQCNACERRFSNQRALSVHTKTYHLMERTVPK